jgi:hypothetical protein
VIHNGVEIVTIRTRHGLFDFGRFRLKARDGQREEVKLPCPRVSSPLRQRVFEWANRVQSFADLAGVVTECAGTSVLSEDSVWRLVQDEAQRLDEDQLQNIVEAEPVPEPTYVAPDDVYDPEAKEFVVMTDAIGVKAQKPTRERKGEPKKPKQEKRHDTDVLILPRPDGQEHFVSEGTSGRWTLVEAVRAFLRSAWAGKTLRVVALTDGAKSIRTDLLALFGIGIFIILDWYHLKKRVYQQLSMAAHSMKEREEWEQNVLTLLWHGHVDKAKELLVAIKPRNQKALQDLIGYLDKHAEEIIDYERRQKAGKVIGSGRMEKGVDQAVGDRQKGKGMSWTLQGSRALALLKVHQLNQRTATA